MQQQQPPPPHVADGATVTESSGKPCEASQLEQLAERFFAVLASKRRSGQHCHDRRRHCLWLIGRMGVSTPDQITEEGVELALGAVLLLGRGRSSRTRNHHLSSIGQFCRWMVRNRLLAFDPTAGIEKLPEDADRWHERTVFSDEEMTRLLAETLASGESYHGCTPADRAALYLAPMATGFRLTTIRLLTVEAFRLTGDAPGVAVQGRQIKSRRTRFQELRPDDAAFLARYFTGKMPMAPAFKVPRRNSDFIAAFRCDLARARIPYCSETPDGRRERVRDYHALRHSFATRMLLRGTPLTVVQRLMDHSSPETTAKIYAHVSQSERSAFLAAMPPLVPRAG